MYNLTKRNITYLCLLLLFYIGIFTTPSDIENATKEILKMYQFDHINVMPLIGVCLASTDQGGSGGPTMVMPFMDKGSLLNYLREEASNLFAATEEEV